MATKNDKSPGSHEILHTLGYRRLRSLFSCRQVVWVGVCLCLLALPDCPTTTPSGTTKQWSLVPNVASSEPYGSFLVLSDDPSSLRSRSNGTVPSRYLPNWESLDKRPLPLWYDQAKIGILIHWGVFSVPSFGSEWFWYHWKAVPREFYTRFMRKYYALNFIYTDFVTQFTARFFDPHQWAHLFKLAGARYVVLTSKHFDGFTLWPSSTSGNWNAVDAGPKRDLVGELAAAVKKARGMKFGLYHARYEWFNPLYQADKASDWENNSFVENKSIPELMEIVNKYQPEVIWSDGDWEAPDTYWKSMEFFAWLYNESPVRESVVVNDRWGDGTHCNHGIFYSCKDRYYPRVLHLHKWENSMSIDKLSWGYRREAKLSD